jgi:hypothetical protein
MILVSIVVNIALDHARFDPPEFQEVKMRSNDAFMTLVALEIKNE